MKSRESILLYQECIGITIDTLTCRIYNLASTITKNLVITFRIKDSETLRKKMLRKNTLNIFSIHDIYGIRILVNSIDNAYHMLKLINLVFPMYLANDFIKKPRLLFDYGFKGKSFKCLRIVAYENNVPFEIQITTYEFHLINELHHVVYHRKLYSKL